MAMGVFVIAAVSLAEAINAISLTVSESIEHAEAREKLRAMLLEVSHDPELAADEWSTEPDEAGVRFDVRVERLDLANENGEPVSGLFEVSIEAFGTEAGKDAETALGFASTLVYPELFSKRR